MNHNIVLSLISLIPETCYCSQRCNVKTLAIHLKYSLKNYTTPLVMKVDKKMMNLCHLCPIILLHELNLFIYFFFSENEHIQPTMLLLIETLQ